MGAYDLIKDIGTTLATSDLNKEVISLLEKKLALLKEDLLSLTTDLEEATAREAKLERDNSNLRQKLQDLQPTGFVEHMGVLWKRSGSGYESLPYCKQCRDHPIMSPMSRHLVCGSGDHFVPRSVCAPSAE